jgi:hypothetical protein
VNCRNRLASEQALSARAAEVLAVAAPANVTAPRFEAIRAQAGRRATRGLPLTWAASIILALGLGWFGHGWLQQPPARMAEARTEAAQPGPADAAAAPNSAPTAEAVTEAGTAASGPAEVAPDTRARGSAAAPPAAPVPAPALADAAAQKPAELALNELKVEEVQITGAKQGFADTALAARPQAARELPPATAQARARNTAESALRAEAASLGAAQALYAVPDVEIVHIRTQDDFFQVQQRLPDGKEIFVESERQDPAAGEVRKTREPAAVNAFAFERNGRRLVIRGALPPDSLRALAARVK